MPVTLQNVRELIEVHRAKDMLTCPEDCFCWIVEGLLFKWEREERNDLWEMKEAQERRSLQNDVPD